MEEYLVDKSTLAFCQIHSQSFILALDENFQRNKKKYFQEI